jgi:hypothetical protein
MWKYIQLKYYSNTKGKVSDEQNQNKIIIAKPHERKTEGCLQAF